MEETIPYVNDGDTRFISMRNACYRRELRKLNPIVGGNDEDRPNLFNELDKLVEHGVHDRYLVFTLDKDIAIEIQNNSFGHVLLCYIEDINEADEKLFQKMMKTSPNACLFDIDLKEKFGYVAQQYMLTGHDVIYF